MNRKISIIISVVRPQLQARQRKLIRQNVCLPEGQYEVIALEDTGRIGAPRMVNRLVDRAKHDLVCFIGDDCLPRYGFLIEALKAMQGLPDGWGLVGLNDYLMQQHFSKKGLVQPAAHFLASKKLLPLIGGSFFSEQYTHCFCDWELTDKARAFGRYAFCETALLEHNHPVLKKDSALMDEHYSRVYRHDTIEHDRQTYIKRMMYFKNGNGNLNVVLSGADA